MNNDFQTSLVVLAVTVVVILILWRLAWWLTRLGMRSWQTLSDKAPQSKVWAKTHPLRASLQQRYPRSYAWLARRLSPRHFTGLPLLLMILAAIYFVSLMAGIVEDVIEAEEIDRFDNNINRFFDPYRLSLLVKIIGWLTDVGGSEALVGVVIVATGFLWADKRPLFIMPLWITYVGAELTTWIGKFGFGRARPEFITGVTALSPSFPSAHATGTMAVYGFVAYAIARDLHTARHRFEVTFWAAVLIMMIGFSRIFLSVHYTSDVITGLLVGGFWLLVGFALTEYRRERQAIHT